MQQIEQNVSDKLASVIQSKPKPLYSLLPLFVNYRDPLLEDITRLVRKMLQDILFNKLVVTCLELNSSN